MSRVAAALCFAVIFGAVALAEELVEPISLEIRVVNPGTGRETEPIAGEPLILDARFRDTLLDRPHSLQRPRGLLRPAPDGGSGDCSQIARALRATDAFARGDIALDGFLLALLSQEGRISVVDPQMSLATSNILRVIDLRERPVDLVVSGRGALYAILAQRDALAHIDAASGAVAPIDGVAAPIAIAPTSAGVAAVARDGAALLIEGARRWRVSLTFTPSGVSAAQDGSLLFFDAKGRFARVSPSGRTLAAIDIGSGIRAFEYSPRADAVIAIASEAPEATLHFLDASQVVRIALAHAADALFVSPDGRYAVAAARSPGAASIIDLASAQTVQAVAFEGVVSDVAFTDRSIFFLLDGRRTAAILALNSIVKGKEPTIRLAPLGDAPEPSPEQPGLVARAPDGAMLLVASPSRRAVLNLADSGLHASASFAAINLKGDAPVKLLAIPRGLREIGQGRYEALVAFARGGRHRLIVFDSANAPVVCRDIAVRPSAAAATLSEAAPRRALVISALRRTQEGVEVCFEIEAANGGASAIRALVAQSLVTGWRAQTQVRSAQPGFCALIAHARPGPTALYAIFEGGARSAPTVVEIAP